jgi:hypothetical protein
MSGTDWNDNVVNVEAEAIVEFEIIATYDLADGESGGAKLKVLKEIEVISTNSDLQRMNFHCFMTTRQFQVASSDIWQTKA